MEHGMTEQELPIELECWLLKHGILPVEYLPSKPDVVWPEIKEDLTKVSKGWKPTYEGEQPPF